VVQNCIFSYKKTQSEKKEKHPIDLRTAKVMIGQRDNTDAYIYIQQETNSAEAIRISFADEREFNKWLEVIQQNRKSDP